MMRVQLDTTAHWWRWSRTMFTTCECINDRTRERRRQRYLFFQTRNLNPQRNAADDTQRLRMHADAVQQRRYEGSIIEARRYERVPQLRVLLPPEHVRGQVVNQAL